MLITIEVEIEELENVEAFADVSYDYGVEDTTVQANGIDITKTLTKSALESIKYDLYTAFLQGERAERHLSAMGI